MKKKLLHNWPLKIAALVLALIVWFVVAQIGDPRNSKTFYNVSVTLTNTNLLDAEDKVYEILDDTDTIRVTVSAPKSVISSLSASDIVATADVSKLTEINTINIELDIPDASYESIECSPATVRLSVENRKSKWINVSANLSGEAAEGYLISSVSLDQTQIQISGPESVIDEISYAAVEVDVSGATRDLSASMDVKLYDDAGNLLSYENVTKNVDAVKVSVVVYATKEVPVEINYSGEVADGFVLTGEVTSDPEMVTIAGYASALLSVNAVVIPAERIDVSDAEADVEVTVNLNSYLPENVKWADSSFNGRISVQIGVDEIVKKTLRVPVSNINLTNIPADALEEDTALGLPADASYVEVTILGRSVDLNQIVAADVSTVFDVGAWMTAEGLDVLGEGTYDITLEFSLPEGVTLSKDVTCELVVRSTAEDVNEE